MLDGSIDHTPGSPQARWLAAAAIVALTVAVAGAGAAAQTSGDGTGIVTGTVRPAAGQPMSDVEIVFAGAEQVRARTNAAGEFTVGLPAGSYRSRIKVPGFKMAEAVIDVQSGDRLDRHFTLTLAELAETIHVSGVPGDAGERIDLSPHVKLPTSIGVITLPRRLDDPMPEYPLHLRDAGVEGTVTLKARMDPDGRVYDFDVVRSPHVELSRAVIDAVGRWRYAPTRVQGTPVATGLVVTVDYRAK